MYVFNCKLIRVKELHSYMIMTSTKNRISEPSLIFDGDFLYSLYTNVLMKGMNPLHFIKLNRFFL